MKSQFFKVYSNLPEDIRREIIVVIDKKPYTWNAAFYEVNEETELGLRILEKLNKMELI